MSKPLLSTASTPLSPIGSVVESSLLLDWAQAVHRFEKRAAKEEDAASPLDVFVLSPGRKALGTVLRFALTTLAIFVAPEQLHASRLRADENPFLPYRSFVVAAIALYDILGGQLVRVQSLDAMTDPMLKSVVKSAANAAALLYFTGAMSLAFWVAAALALACSPKLVPEQFGVEGGAAVPGPPAPRFPGRSAVRMACYAMGVGPVLRLTSFAYGPLFQSLLASTLPRGAKTGLFLALIGAFALYYVHVTFVAPVRVIEPKASTLALWIAYVVAMFLMFLALWLTEPLMSALFPGQSYRIGI